jgi:hypothetical protein
VVESVDPEGLHLVVVGSPQSAPPISAERT